MTGLGLAAGEHVVYFYEDHQHLVDVAVGYLAASLAEGGGAIAIATPTHRAVFAAQLQGDGVDVASAERDGRLVFLDARTTLDQFVIDGVVDTTRFREIVMPLVTGLVRDNHAVHAFGEMVGLLWDDGSIDGVIALESMWNDLLADRTFSLLCGYPATVLKDGASDPVVQICNGHSDIVSSLPAPVAPEACKTFPKSLTSPARARSYVTDVLSSWGHPEDLHDVAALVVTELSVNAVKHADSGFTVSLDRVGDRVRITVGDNGSVPPRKRPKDERSISGRGLWLVDALAEAWGSTPARGGKLVWAELATAAVPG